MSKSARSGFILAGAYGFAALLYWLGVILDPESGWVRFAVATGFTLLAGFALASAFRLRREEQRAPASPESGD